MLYSTVQVYRTGYYLGNHSGVVQYSTSVQNRLLPGEPRWCCRVQYKCTEPVITWGRQGDVVPTRVVARVLRVSDARCRIVRLGRITGNPTVYNTSVHNCTEPVITSAVCDTSCVSVSCTGCT